MQDAINDLKMSLRMWGRKPQKESYEKAIKALERECIYEKLCIEYLGKCREYGCDSCVAEIFCIENGLRKDRYPHDGCVENLKAYLEHSYKEAKNR